LEEVLLPFPLAFPRMWLLDDRESGFVSHSYVENSLFAVRVEDAALLLGVVKLCKTGDHGPSILLKSSVSQQGSCGLFQGCTRSLDFEGIKGDEDLRHLHTITSPAADTMIDSVLDNAKEHRLANLDRISVSEQSWLDDEVDNEELVVGTFRLFVCATTFLFSALYPGVFGGKHLDCFAGLDLSMLCDDG
jgi:hypothetical protein